MVAFLEVNFTTGPGITGWIMTICLAVIVWFATENKRRAHFERFWYSHHLFIIFFINWQLHGVGVPYLNPCRSFLLTPSRLADVLPHQVPLLSFVILAAEAHLISFHRPDRPPYCSYQQIGVFWKYWLVGGALYIAERVLREVRSRHRTYISKVILHPSNVCEVHIKKEKTKTRAGQYIFL